MQVAPLQYDQPVVKDTVKLKAVCAFIANVTMALQEAADASVAATVLDFLQHYNTYLYQTVGRCAWNYACAPGPLAPQPWSRCLQTLQHVFTTLLRAPDVQSNWYIASEEWAKFALAVSSGCCARLPDGQLGARWVVRQTPNVNPYFGRTICMPTLEPALDTQRSFGSKGECEMALTQLPPQQDYVPINTPTVCNEYGCSNEVQWGRKPSYTVECVNDTLGCGPSLQLGSRVGGRGLYCPGRQWI